MPGTVTDDIQIIVTSTGRGRGGGDVPAGGDDDGGDGNGSGLPAIPRRAYYTAMQLGLAGIIMFFMALTSSFLVRKALGAIKQSCPDAIVAEFNFQSDFRDRTSSLESLLAVVQRMPRTKVIVFYENEQAHQLAKLMARFPVHEALAYPIDARKLEESLRRIPR